MMSGMGGMVMTGMALGAGSEIGHQAVRAVGNAMGGGSSGAPAEHGQAPVQQQQYAQAPMEQQTYQEQPCFNFQQSFS